MLVVAGFEKSAAYRLRFGLCRSGTEETAVSFFPNVQTILSSFD